MHQFVMIRRKFDLDMPCKQKCKQWNHPKRPAMDLIYEKDDEIREKRILELLQKILV